MIRWLLALVLVLVPTVAQAVLMLVDQPRLQAGEHLHLRLETRTNREEAPEVTWPRAWEVHLQLLDKQHQVEPLGRGYYQHRWQLSWQHRDAQARSGRLSLPPLRVGGRAAQPLNLELRPAPPRPEAPQPLNQPLEMFHQVERQQVYPGESLLYELVIRYRGYPREPRLSLLTFEGGQARNLDEGREQGFNQRGVHWQEARWQAILHIQDEEARVLPRYFSSRLDLPGQGRGERYEAQVPALEFQVRPLPETWPEQAAWLPAQGLELAAHWQTNPTAATQGQPQELLIQMNVVGQQAQSLPLFEPLSLPQVHMEALSEQRRNRVIDGHLVGQLEQRLLVYPLTEGSVQLPPLQLSWWNLLEEHLEKSQLSLPPLQVAALREPQKEGGDLAFERQETPPPNWGLLLALALASLLLSGLIGLAWLFYQQQPRQQLRQALRQGPSHWTHAQLLQLVKAHGLEAEAEQLLKTAARGQRIATPVIRRQLIKSSKHPASTKAALPPLNP